MLPSMVDCVNGLETDVACYFFENILNKQEEIIWSDFTHDPEEQLTGGNFFLMQRFWACWARTQPAARLTSQFGGPYHIQLLEIKFMT